jgi:hypothetical protein
VSLLVCVITSTTPAWETLPVAKLPPAQLSGSLTTQALPLLQSGETIGRVKMLRRQQRALSVALLGKRIFEGLIFVCFSAHCFECGEAKYIWAKIFQLALLLLSEYTGIKQSIFLKFIERQICSAF